MSFRLFKTSVLIHKSKIGRGRFEILLKAIKKCLNISEWNCFELQDHDDLVIS
jgi:hypothetical protein